jgi:hypothetical protein
VVRPPPGPPAWRSPRTGLRQSPARAGPCGPGRCWSWPRRPQPRGGPAGSASRQRPVSVGVEAYAACALRAWLAESTRSAPHGPVREVVRDLLLRTRHDRTGCLPPAGRGRGGPGRHGPSPPSCPACRSWFRAWGRTGPYAARRCLHRGPVRDHKRCAGQRDRRTGHAPVRSMVPRGPGRRRSETGRARARGPHRTVSTHGRR